MKELITNKLSKKQIDEINTILYNLPRKLTTNDKIKRVSFDMLGFVLLIIYAYIKYDFSFVFFLLVILTILMIGSIIYCHTNERKNYKIDLFFLKFKSKIKTNTQYRIKISKDKITISRKGNNYSNISKVLYWNNLIICIVEDEENNKKFAFLNFNNNDKTEFLNEVKNIYNLSLETVNKDINLNDY